MMRHAGGLFAGTLILVLAPGLLFLTGCGHPRHTRTDVPAPPLPDSSAGGSASRPDGSGGNDHESESGNEPAEPSIPVGSTPLATEIGKASWYGPPYHNRRGSNGEIYNMHAMTAAHRTLPLGSIVRVTNLKTGHAALVRITDRGPFIPGRVLDLSLAAARKVDIYQPGVAEVRVDVMQTPAPLETGGKWALQIGGFREEHEARKLADHLKRRYHTAKVLCFGSPAGDWWIRVRVLDDDRERARKLAAETETTDGAVFLVRLD